MEFTANEAVAQNIRSRRTAKEWSRSDLADAVNRYLTNPSWTETVVVNIEGRKGRSLRATTPEELVALARVFGVSVISLMLPPENDAVIVLGGSRLFREEYGWLVFHILPEYLSQDRLGLLADEAMYQAFKIWNDRYSEWLEPFLNALGFFDFETEEEWRTKGPTVEHIQQFAAEISEKEPAMAEMLGSDPDHFRGKLDHETVKRLSIRLYRERKDQDGDDHQD